MYQLLTIASEWFHFTDHVAVSSPINFVSTPWKIIIPLRNSVGDHIWVIQMHLGG